MDSLGRNGYRLPCDARGRITAFYLTHLYDGTKNRVGSIFLDCRNAHDFSDQNSVLYGHHMKSGKMFASLKAIKAVLL